MKCTETPIEGCRGLVARRLACPVREHPSPTLGHDTILAIRMEIYNPEHKRINTAIRCLIGVAMALGGLVIDIYIMDVIAQVSKCSGDVETPRNLKRNALRRSLP